MGNPHLFEQREFGDFPWLLEKSCTFRTAYARNRNKKARVNRQHQTAEARGGAVNCNLKRSVPFHGIILQKAGKKCERHALSPALNPFTGDIAVAFPVLHDSGAS